VSTLGVELGLDPAARAVILHADDVGLCHAHNQGFFDLLDAGLVRCGSVLTCCAWFLEAAEFARRRPDADLGVHLCLNSEFSGYRWGPVTAADRVPSLVDANGYFWPSPSETLERADPEEAATELRAQIDRALDNGIDVTHLDAHMGTPMMRSLLPVYLALGREYRLPVFFPRPSRQMLEEVGHPELVPELGDILSGLDAERLLMVDHVELRSLTFEAERAEEHYRRVIAELSPGVTHVLLHPARDGDELRAITPGSAAQRDAERRLFAGEGIRRTLDEAGVQVIGYRVLRDRMLSASA
jgi:chitin disaccharide deacetylase